MRLDTTMTQRMDQRMILAPRMIQSMEILQLPIMALQERIQQELQENPVLEQKEAGDDGPTADGEPEDIPAPVAEEMTRGRATGRSGSTRETCRIASASRSSVVGSSARFESLTTPASECLSERTPARRCGAGGVA